MDVVYEFLSAVSRRVGQQNAYAVIVKPSDFVCGSNAIKKRTDQ
jgi:hypothetical protein